MSDAYAGVVEQIQSFYAAASEHLARSVEFDGLQRVYDDLRTRGLAALAELEVDRPARFVVADVMSSPERLEAEGLPLFREVTALLEAIRDANAVRLGLSPLLDEAATYPPLVAWQNDALRALDEAWQGGIDKERERVEAAVTSMRELKQRYPSVLASWSQQEQALRQSIDKENRAHADYTAREDTAKKALSDYTWDAFPAAFSGALVAAPIGCTMSAAWSAATHRNKELDMLTGFIVGAALGLLIALLRYSKQEKRTVLLEQRRSLQGSAQFSQQALNTLQAQLDTHLSQRPERSALAPPPISKPSPKR